MSTWLRWSARHGTQWPIDPSFFPPALVQAYQQAASEARAASDPVDGVATSWRWPNAFNLSATGTIEAVSSDPTVQFSVDVAGRGSFQGGSSLSLQPGSYELNASAEGFEPVRLTREVLPGVGTVLEFDLKPLLAAGVEASVSTSLVLIRAGLGGSAICTNGLIARPGGLVLTTLSALPATQGLEVVANSGQVYPGVSVATSDQARDLAVLRLEGSAMSPQPNAPSALNLPYAWSVYHPQCGAATSTRTRLADGTGASLAPPLPADARGAPLVDRNGALMGIVMGPALFAPLALADAILAQAAAPVVATVEPPQVEVRRGGFPIGWVGAGAALAGLGAFLLTGGDEVGGDTVGGGTGTIVITIPGT